MSTGEDPGAAGARTATLGPRRTPGLVPVTETMRTTERHEPEPAPAAPPEPAARATWAFWRLLGSELGLTFRRPRNLAMLAVLGVVPVVVGVALRMFGSSDDDMSGLVQDVAGNSLMLTFVSFSFLVLLLMPVAVSVVAGDSIAGEAGGGTLRYLLAAPAGRTRLLVIKYLNAVVYAYAVTAVVALSALVTGLVLFPAGDVTLLSGTTVPLAEGCCASPSRSGTSEPAWRRWPRSRWRCRCSPRCPSGPSRGPWCWSSSARCCGPSRS
ncbi:ABC transporter permease [Nonomuraea thailandensis]